MSTAIRQQQSMIYQLKITKTALEEILICGKIEKWTHHPKNQRYHCTVHGTKRTRIYFNGH